MMPCASHSPYRTRSSWLNGAASLLDWPTMTLVVKLGSSVVVDDAGELREKVLANICAQIDELTREGESIVLVTSGAIARGTNLLGIERRPKAMDELQASSAIGQADIFRAYANRLKRRGTKSAQILLSRSDIENRANY